MKIGAMEKWENGKIVATYCHMQDRKIRCLWRPGTTSTHSPYRCIGT